MFRWGANIYEYDGDKRTNIKELIKYNFKNDTYYISNYVELKCHCMNYYDECECYPNTAWNRKIWTPSKDLIYKLVEGEKVFDPDYKKISEILEFMRIKEHRKAYMFLRDIHFHDIAKI